MAKFKKGDRVRLLEDCNYYYDNWSSRVFKSGEIATVVRGSKNRSRIQIKTYSFMVWNEILELAP